jgi:hypothetical protein
MEVSLARRIVAEVVGRHVSAGDGGHGTGCRQSGTGGMGRLHDRPRCRGGNPRSRPAHRCLAESSPYVRSAAGHDDRRRRHGMGRPAPLHRRTSGGWRTRGHRIRHDRAPTRGRAGAGADRRGRACGRTGRDTPSWGERRRGRPGGALETALHATRGMNRAHAGARAKAGACSARRGCGQVRRADARRNARAGVGRCGSTRGRAVRGCPSAPC